MEVHHSLTLYLTSPTVVTVDAVQGDGVRVIAARLMEGAEAWPVPEGVTAGIGYELPDKTGGYYDQLRDGTPACMIAGNLVTAAIDGSLTAAAGNVKLAIVLRDGNGGQVATFPIALRVAKRPGRIGAAEMVPPSAYEGKLLMGGRAGDIVSVEIGAGLSLERTPTGATLSAPGGGGSGEPGGSCDCGAPYIASEEPPEDTGAMWVNTSEQDEAVALGATVKETADGVEIYATDELGTTRAKVRHGKDGAAGAPGEKGDPGDPGAPGADGITPHIGENGNWWIGGTDTGKPSRGADGDTPVKGVDYFTPAEVRKIAEQAAGMVKVPEGGGSAGGGLSLPLLYEVTTTEEVRWIDTGKSAFDAKNIVIIHLLSKATATNTQDNKISGSIHTATTDGAIYPYTNNIIMQQTEAGLPKQHDKVIRAVGFRGEGGMWTFIHSIRNRVNTSNVATYMQSSDPDLPDLLEPITGVVIGDSFAADGDKAIGAGSVLKIWGC